MLYDIQHVTTVRYSRPVAVSHHRLNLWPRSLPHQTCHAHTLRVRPSAVRDDVDEDYFGNRVTYLAVERPHRTLVIEARSRVEVMATPPPDAQASPPWEAVRDDPGGDREGFAALEFAFDSPYSRAGPALGRYARPSFKPGRPVLAAGIDLMRRIHADFTFDGAATEVDTTVDEAFTKRRGVCQDFSHVMLACLRQIGLPGRYVSGYLRTRPPKGGVKLRGVDASHAWVEIYAPGIGWVGLDPTNDCLASIDHIAVAWGRDYGDVSPIVGVIVGGGAHTVDVAVDVDLESDDAHA